MTKQDGFDNTVLQYTQKLNLLSDQTPNLVTDLMIHMIIINTRNNSLDNI